MVEAAKKKIDLASEQGLVRSNFAFRFEVADAQDLSSIETGSVTFAGCALSFNLIPRRDLAMREMRRVLAADGRAVVANFKVTATAALAGDFAAFIGAVPTDPATGEPVLPSAVKGMITACADSVELAAELKAAGFASVDVTEASFTFQTGDVATILAVFRGNPAISQCFTGAPEGTDFEGQWVAFLAPGGPGHSRYILASPEGPKLRLAFVANVAVASA